jgi:hypothetical protein
VWWAGLRYIREMMVNTGPMAHGSAKDPNAQPQPVSRAVQVFGVENLQLTQAMVGDSGSAGDLVK